MHADKAGALLPAGLNWVAQGPLLGCIISAEHNRNPASETLQRRVQACAHLELVARQFAAVAPVARHTKRAGDVAGFAPASPRKHQQPINLPLGCQGHQAKQLLERLLTEVPCPLLASHLTSAFCWAAQLSAFDLPAGQEHGVLSNLPSKAGMLICTFVKQTTFQQVHLHTVC